ncbi:MAG: hypothetical protein NTX03_03125 [Bacteroidetes bacterium]|nr:hypothetical protein [Bacteroidota bacterium]
MNHLEELIAEWYDYQGYFVKRNIKVGPRERGGYDGELDVVAFHPKTKHLIHLEISSDTISWAEREIKFKRNFDLGKIEIPKLFIGIDIPNDIDQRAVFLLGAKSRDTVGGGKLEMISDYMTIIKHGIKEKSVERSAIPEKYPLLRTLQLAWNLKYKQQNEI